jgi:hypothetical protein
MKIYILFILIIHSFTVLSQSKKERIRTLNSRVDSLINVIYVKEQLSSSMIGNFNQEISVLNQTNKKLEIDLKNSNALNTRLVIENNIKTDSLKQLRYETSNSTSSSREVNSSLLKKVSTSSMVDIYDWLNQFKEISKNSISYFDKEVLKFYIGDGPESNYADNSIGKVEISTIIYEEGIVFMQRSEFESNMFVLYVPILDVSFVKKQVDRLCRSMGGCLGPNEVNVRYELTDFGVKVSFGGGC